MPEEKQYTAEEMAFLTDFREKYREQIALYGEFGRDEACKFARKVQKLAVYESLVASRAIQFFPNGKISSVVVLEDEEQGGAS